jgi:N-acetylmuramoyl-L-alanine amidase
MGRILRELSIITMLVFLCFFSVVGAVDGRVLVSDALFSNLTIVIDPGHGGSDIGVKGPRGVVEKDVVLGLAKILKKELGPKFTVILTRSGDYFINLTDRASKANHLKADLFFSLHLGGSFSHNANCWSLFYHDPKFRSSLAVQATRKQDGSDQHNLPWNEIQTRHKESSMRFARDIQESFFQNVRKPIAVSDFKIYGEPMALLKSLDMPAVLLELDYLTNPAAEKKMTDQKILSEYAKIIIKGVDNFLKNK